VDPSALIFVALAVAWAVYLVPKALQQHDEAVRSRSVERFSASMRVLARREPVGRKDARLVVTPGRKISLPTIHTKVRSTRTDAAVDQAAVDQAAVDQAAAPSSVPATGTPAAGRTPEVRPRPGAAATAARRRRRVLGLVLTALVAVATVAAFGVISWAWTAIPGGLLAAWLVACRLMVRSERRARQAGRTASTASTAPATEAAGPVADEGAAAAMETGAGVLGPVAEAPQQVVDPDAWDMIPQTLPTYVSAPAAVRRTVQTIDLDSTGVWSSGRNADDSALAREAEGAQRAAREAEERRATGS
jgi:nitrate reductase NapE component